jgi:hypothetical protein
MYYFDRASEILQGDSNSSSGFIDFGIRTKAILSIVVFSVPTRFSPSDGYQRYSETYKTTRSQPRRPHVHLHRRENL